MPLYRSTGTVATTYNPGLEEVQFTPDQNHATKTSGSTWAVFVPLEPLEPPRLVETLLALAVSGEKFVRLAVGDAVNDSFIRELGQAAIRGSRIELRVDGDANGLTVVGATIPAPNYG